MMGLMLPLEQRALERPLTGECEVTSNPDPGCLFQKALSTTPEIFRLRALEISSYSLAVMALDATCN